MKRVLLIQPPFFRFIGLHSRYFPYQLVSIGTYLKKNGHEVKVLEGDQFKKDGKLDFSNQESLYDHYLNNLYNCFCNKYRAILQENQSSNRDHCGRTPYNFITE
jgi:hypothetical protein